MDKHQNRPSRAGKSEEKTGAPARGAGASHTKLKPSFFREAQLFCTPERATLTFFNEGGVASIHYDQMRNEIFFKGHNVKNMTLTEDQWVYLQKFSEVLSGAGGDPELHQAYEACLHGVFPGRH